ncbi:universal stress protein [uncultured Hyphomicrobium sp.]|jgi:nucleotide-binding universal stress UspA family protein|uniref:universal stress protein n=1 Tax=uncultured Hyphomicrobium sp. TaxID=194373 RepID=UPI0025DD3934|nr:universal stress protein [uncultured Hyphomicrobium sp.]
MFKHILIATDGSDLAQAAAKKGLELASALGAKVTAVTVTPSWAELMPGETAVSAPVEEYVGATRGEADGVLCSVAEQAKWFQVECICRHEAEQLPAEGILAAAKATACDLIVMSTHGRRGLQRLFLGSQAQKVLTHSTVPILICR